jgi:hypothetical protein
MLKDGEPLGVDVLHPSLQRFERGTTHRKVSARRDTEHVLGNRFGRYATKLPVRAFGKPGARFVEWQIDGLVHERGRYYGGQAGASGRIADLTGEPNARTRRTRSMLPAA